MKKPNFQKSKCGVRNLRVCVNRCAGAMALRTTQNVTWRKVIA